MNNLAKDIKYINPFIMTTIRLMNEVAGIQMQRRNLKLAKGLKVECGFSVVTRIAKHLNGLVAYDFSPKLASRITEIMNGIPRNQLRSQEEFDQLKEATIIEFCNMVSGRAITLLYEEHINCKVSPPDLYVVKGIEILDESNDVLILPMQTEIGPFQLGLNLTEDEFYS